MTIEERIPLASLTTLRSGGPAAFVASCERSEQVAEALAFAKERGLRSYALGQGSNVLASDEGFDGLILLMRIPGMEFSHEGEHVLATCGAGVSWDALVAEAASRGLWGIENLAGIPGTLGAAPVQNIGAYGQELAETLRHVDAYDASTGASVRLAREECAFGYRESRFKLEPNLIITSVTLALSRAGSPDLSYADIAAASRQGAALTIPGEIGAEVRRIRSEKFPDLAAFGCAGSFFKNPIVSEREYARLVSRFGPVPRRAQADGIKIPLAYLLDALGMKGLRHGGARLYERQPLILVLDARAPSSDAEELACEVEKRVKEAAGVDIAREVRSLSNSQK